MDVPDGSVHYRWWKYLCLAVMACVVASMLYWSWRHPRPSQWDENEYLNAVHRDGLAKRNGGWTAYARSLIHTHPYRPPAYRVLMLPVSLTAGPNLLVLRTAGVILFLVATWYMYRGVAAIADRPAGLLGAVLFGCSIGMIDACRWYGSEFASYLAVTASMWLVFRICLQRSTRHVDWIGLGVAMAIGLLAKLSYPWIVGPMFAVAGVLAIARRVPWTAIGRLAGATAVAAALVAPWYLANFDNYLALARLNQTWDRASIGNTTWQAVGTWLSNIYTRGFGPVLTVLLVAAIVAGGLMLVRRGLSSAARMALAMCLAAAIPFPLAQLLFSVNYSARIVTPAFIPLIAAVAIVVASSGLLRHRATFAVVAVAIGLQLALVVWPLNRKYYALWDLRPMIAVAGLENDPDPHIAFLGVHANFDAEGFATPFLERGIEPKLTPLWYSSQPLDWDSIHAKALAADAVVVVPDYDGTDMAWLKFDRDNAHNRQFDHWLRTSGRFDGPRSFTVGDRPAYTCNVYVRRSP